MPKRADASRARREEGVGRAPATDEQRSSAPQMGGFVSVRRLIDALVIAAIAGMIALGCVRNNSRTHRVHHGTCEGACAHYMNCKQSADEQLYDACVLECPDVFADEQALREFEDMTCEATLDFVEGDSGRPPGEPLEDSTSGAAAGAGASSSSSP